MGGFPGLKETLVSTHLTPRNPLEKRCMRKISLHAGRAERLSWGVRGGVAEDGEGTRYKDIGEN